MRKWLTSGKLITAIEVWLVFSTAVVVAIAPIGARPRARAKILMGGGLIFLRMIVGGSLMRLARDPIRKAVMPLRMDWRVKFVLFATFLALIEEAIATGITNLAPLFGVPLGAVYITASANYLEVIGLHSVVVFVPMFVGWAFLLSRLDFSPNAVFLLFGFTGVTAAANLSGWQAFTEFGMWIFIYGLMVYLPAYCIPQERGTSRPRSWQYAIAVLVPVLFAIPVAVVIGILHPMRVDFPPIPPGT
jgi:hypothetical protein